MHFNSNILLYPYPYKIIAVLGSAFICYLLFMIVNWFYRLIISNVDDKKQIVFHRILKITGICLLVIFLAELMISTVTQHQVNRQLGFNYATPETPEGEFFEIVRVDSGKIMEQSGLKVNDRIQMPSVAHLYRLLLNNQREEVSFIVLRKNVLVVINVQVPEMKVPLRKLAIMF